MRISHVKFLGIKFAYLLALFLFVLLYASGSIYWLLTQNALSEPSFTRTDLCPVCHGTSLCHSLTLGRLRVQGWPNMGILWFKSKDVYPAFFDEGRGQQVELRRLGSDLDFLDVQARLCLLAELSGDCDIQEALPRLSFIREQTGNTNFVKHLQGSSKLFVCPSTRLISRMLAHYKEQSGHPGILPEDKVHLWTTTYVNQAPLIAQMFPSTDGWPFPAYHGACGQYVVTSGSGNPLSHYYHAVWKTRAGLAYQLMRTAELLTDKEDFALYFTEINEDTFVVNSTGHVLVGDLRNILVVDKLAVKSANLNGWDNVHESSYTDCKESSLKSCRSFSEAQLCGHVTSDHNYYAICRYVLWPNYDVTGNGVKTGLLRDIPEVAVQEWDLEYLLNECVSPERQRGREQVVHKLIEALGILSQ